jgi:hypothetical protein
MSEISKEMKIAAVRAYAEITGRCRPVAMQAALEAALSSRPAIGEGSRVEGLEWRDGAPGKPWADEWFIAETTYGDRVVLTSLPEDWSYDFKTADDTYLKADRIKRWMQFPDSQYIPPATERDAPEPVAWQKFLGELETWCCELPDRTSPDDAPEMMLIDRYELELLAEKVRDFLASPPDAELVRMREALDDLCKLTFAVQHNPNCPAPWLVRLPGKGPIDMKPYGDRLRLVAHQTGDILGFGKTFDDAARAALSAKEGQRHE